VRLLRVRLAAAFRLVGVAMDRIDRFLLLLLLFQHKRIQEREIDPSLVQVTSNLSSLILSLAQNTGTTVRHG